MERLSKALNMDEISQEVGVDLQTESMLVRAEQLARLESDKIVDKVSALLIFLLLCEFNTIQFISQNSFYAAGIMDRYLVYEGRDPSTNCPFWEK